MTEYEIHKLIEQQDPEAKQRIWEKIQSKLQEEKTMTRQEQAIQKINAVNPSILTHLQDLKKQCENGYADTSEVAQYLNGLRDCGAITESERRTLYIHFTPILSHYMRVLKKIKD